MKKYFPIFLVISIILGAVMFLATNNIIISIVICVISIIAALILFIPKLVLFYQVAERYHDCYHFINNFVISLSIKNSIQGALEATMLSMGRDFKEFYSKLEDMSDRDKVHYLESYFPFYTYKLFLQIISLWEEEGGDVLVMSNYLLSEIRYEEEYVSSISSLAKHKYIESSSLWMVCIGILVLLRFCLNDFYTKIINLPIFVISLSIFMIFVLFSIYLLIVKATKIDLKGYKQNEKIL